MSNSVLFETRSNGKLLISGEYFVLAGAKALAVPLKLGQTLEVYQTNNNNLEWKAYYKNNLWNEVSFNDKLCIVKASNTSFAKKLQKILITAIKLSDKSLVDLLYKEIITRLEFDPQWGLGSSSTLINNLANYFNINAYELLSLTFTGSGYDIASAQHQNPLFYLLDNGKPKISEVNFNPPFKTHIHFIYLGKKKSSKSDVDKYKKKKFNSEDMDEISKISTLMAVCNNLYDFQSLIDKHESIISDMIKKPGIKQEQFSDFEGSVKSLGAWGGDFVMAVSEKPTHYVIDYFTKKKLNPIYSYNDLVLNRDGLNK